jgi:hypothetical protein
MVLDHPHSNFSHTEPTQAAKDLISSQDALVDIFGRIENFFRRLEEYAEVPTTVNSGDEGYHGQDNGGGAWNVCDGDEGDKAGATK